MADFYAARSRIIPPLPWTSFAPPFSVDRTRYTPTQVVELIRQGGFPNFTMHNHIQLWQQLNGKNPGDGWGTDGDYGNWVWYDRWIDRVRAHCEEQGDQYR